MRILVVNQYYPPDASATAYLLGELTEDLAAGHEVRVVAGRPSYNPESSTFTPSGPTVTRAWSTSFDRSSLAGRGVNYLTFLASSMLAVLAAPRPDVMVALTDPPVVGVVASLAARVRRCPFVFVCHDLYPEIAVALGRLHSPRVIRTWQRLNRLVRSHARRVVVVGRDMRDKLEAEGVPSEKLEWLPNWASPGTASPEAVRALRAERGWEDRLVVMHAGNVGLAQRLDIVVDAAERLQSSRPDVLFVILGDGAAKRGLQEEVARRGLGNVAFVPYRPKDESEAWMAAADVHLVSLSPGLGGCAAPSKLYSIMALGRAFVAAVDVGSEPERVAREGCGVWVPAGDGEALASAVAGMDRAEAAALGRRGLEEFERCYSRRVVTSRYRRMLEEVVGDRAVTGERPKGPPAEP